MNDRCEVPRCRGEVAIDYLGHGVCESHWNELTAEDAPADALRMVLGIKPGAADAMEDSDMATKKQTARKTTKKATGKPAAKGTTKSAVTAKKPAKPKKEELVVFAFRLTQAERDAIHKTAGPRNATQYVRRVATAFAKRDEGAFRAVLKEAGS